jgi:uncharacterized protein (UPF0305 family)
MYIDGLDSLSSLMSIRRHYKKDSRYVNDLYTLTYDNCESLNTISLISSIHNTINTDDDNVSSIVYSNDIINGAGAILSLPSHLNCTL